MHGAKFPTVMYARDGRGWRATVTGVVRGARVRLDCWDETKEAVRHWVARRMSDIGFGIVEEVEVAS